LSVTGENKMKKILKKIDKMFPPKDGKIATLLIYGDGSGMVIRLGQNNIRIPIYDVTPRLLEFNSVEDLMGQLK
jgi:hypothetical protein